ncbi:ABC transporter permease [Nocardia miyunensis]|uniref:ABC transporter permease n=1 Tax=Nocardia miyunensis TaxID=282684 RepID=UPI0008357A20|nr:ABC transporter permease [Nocardia miyunensis]
MFVALRDLRAARGRFALITLVVVLVALLVSFLSGLTSGLAHQNTSALRKMSGDTVVFADTGTSPSFDSSALTADQVRAWRQAAHADPVGISHAQAARGGGPPAQVALFGTETATFGEHSAIEPGSIVLSAPAARDLSAATGDRITLGNATFAVTAISGDDWYAHTPVVWMTLPDWQSLEPRGDAATILVTSDVHDAAAVNAAAHTVTTSAANSLQAIGSYKAENGSLTLMTILLFAISALVIGAFFTVWTIQRTPDIAILKALGATTNSLMADALGQALVVLLIGVGTGLAITSLAGSALGPSVPFVLSAATTLVPGAALIGLGVLGAAVALRFVATADPLTALNRTR